jgi:dipeptidyl-peptidase-4
MDLMKKSNTVFYQSTENSSINRAVYNGIALSGKNKKHYLMEVLGTNAATFSP